MTYPSPKQGAFVVILNVSDLTVVDLCVSAFSSENVIRADSDGISLCLKNCSVKFRTIVLIQDDLVLPTLPTGDELDGVALHKCFVYLNRESFLDRPEVAQFDLLLPIEDDFEGILSSVKNKILTDNFFGIGFLSQTKMQITERHILSSSARTECRQQIIEHINGLAQQVNRPVDGYAQFAAEIQEELLMNALWDANPKVSHADRRTPIQLTSEEAVTTQWGFDGEIFYVAVKDPFGTFGRSTLDKYKRFVFCSDKINAVRVQQDGAGAGIGLYMVIERLSGLIVTVQPGVATEIVAMLRLGQSPRFLSKRDKSFQHFCV